MGSVEGHDYEMRAKEENIACEDEVKWREIKTEKPRVEHPECWRKELDFT